MSGNFIFAVSLSGFIVLIWLGLIGRRLRRQDAMLTGIVTMTEEIRCRQIAAIQALKSADLITLDTVMRLGRVTDEAELLQFIRNVTEARKREAEGMTESNTNLDAEQFKGQLYTKA